MQIVKIKLLISVLVLVGSFSIVNAHKQCNYGDNNRENSGTNFTISTTPVTILANNGNRCAAAIVNVGANNVNCAFRGKTPSATVGSTILPEQGITLGLGDGVIQQVQCIRQGASDSTVTVWESYSQ